MPKITIAQNILAANDTTAQDVQQLLATHGIRTINLMSTPGAGKTTLLERTIERLPRCLGPWRRYPYCDGEYHRG